MFKWTHLWQQSELRVGADGIWIWVRHAGNFHFAPVAYTDQPTLGM